MTYRIRRSHGPEGTVFYLSGEMDAEHAARLEDLLGQSPRGPIVLDLAEVTLVSRVAVRLLALAKTRGIRIESCPDYVRSWIAAESGVTDRR
jgi:anti-anti-sigma regulatory factor